MSSLEVPILYLFDSYPRERATPFRMGLVRNRHELVEYVNGHNGRTNVYLSCFAYERLRAPGRPDYRSALVRHVPLDFDGAPSPSTPHATPEAAVLESFRVHNWLLDRGIEHSADLSGGGVHVFVRAGPERTRLPAAALNGAQAWLERSALGGASKSVDKLSFFGDPARVIRVPNTLNMNKGRWCVPLTARVFEELAAASDVGTAVAEATREPLPVGLEAYVNPGEPLDVSKWDNERHAPLRGRWADVDMGGFASDASDTGVEVVVRSPLISGMVHAEMNNDERGRVIIYLFEQGYSLGEVVRFLREHLSEAKFRHCMYSERQPQRIWARFVGGGEELHVER